MQQPDSPAPSSGDRKTSVLVRGTLWVSLFILAAAAALGGWFAYYALSPGAQVNEPRTTVFIPKGASVQEIGALLEDAGLLEAGPRFMLPPRGFWSTA